MDRWNNRVVLVTGASVGIGAGIAKELVKQGMKVVGCARNEEQLKNLEIELNKMGSGKFIPRKCDLSKDNEVEEMFSWIKKELGGVDVLVNNAGFSNYQTLLTGTTAQWRSMLDVNIVAVCLCSKLAVASMQERGVDDGHIIHISSIAGHKIPEGFAIAHFYSATKHALQALAEGLRREVQALKTHIRVTTICPGAVESEFAARMLPSEMHFLMEKFKTMVKTLTPKEIADSVIYVLSAPSFAQINDLIIMPTEEPNLLDMEGK